MIQGSQRAAALNHVVLAMFAAFALIPVLILFFNSVKSPSEIGVNPLGPPREVHFENFREAWEQGNFARTMRNSVVLVAGTVALVLFLGGLAAYSLARLKPPGSDAFMGYMLAASTLPIWLYLIPLFILWRSLHLLNNPLGLILIYTALNAPLAVFLLRSFLLSVPPELEDAAVVDGATKLQAFFRIILPLAWSSFLTVGLVVALSVWGEFQIALIFIQIPDFYPCNSTALTSREPCGNGPGWMRSTIRTASAISIIGPNLTASSRTMDAG